MYKEPVPVISSRVKEALQCSLEKYKESRRRCLDLEMDPFLMEMWITNSVSQARGVSGCFG